MGSTTQFLGTEVPQGFIFVCGGVNEKILGKTIQCGPVLLEYHRFHDRTRSVQGMFTTEDKNRVHCGKSFLTLSLETINECCTIFETHQSG